MPPRLKMHQELKARGIDNRRLVELLNDAGVMIDSREGPRPVELEDISRRSAKPIPRRWAAALGFEDVPATALPGGDDGDGATDAPTAHERPPQPPPNAKLQLPQVTDRAGAKKRIAWAYSFIGTGLAAGSGYEGIAHVWTDSGPGLAEAWLAAAAENPWCARVVNAAEAGGPVGELVGMHVYLLGATAYVAGAAIPGGDAIFARYSRHRKLPPVAKPDNGRVDGPDAEAAHAGATDAVADVQP